LIHSHVGRLVSCKAARAGLERITGLGSPRVWRPARPARPAPPGPAALRAALAVLGGGIADVGERAPPR
jgi:hypothetical protein